MTFDLSSIEGTNLDARQKDSEKAEKNAHKIITFITTIESER